MMILNKSAGLPKNKYALIRSNLQTATFHYFFPIVSQIWKNYEKKTMKVRSNTVFFFAKLKWARSQKIFWLLGRAQKEAHIFLIIVNYTSWSCSNLKHRFLLDTFTPARNRSIPNRRIFITYCFTKGYNT